MSYRGFIAMMIFFIGAACMVGCLGMVESHAPPKVYVIKEKFQAVSPCGFAASTDYNILTTTGETIRIATTCHVTRDVMMYYSVWNDAEQGDVIMVDMYYDPRYVLKKNTVDEDM